MNQLPILNYHGIEKTPGEYSWTPAEKPYTVSLTSFEAELRLVAHQGFKSLGLKELESWKGELLSETLIDGALPKKKVAFTFDDAHVSHLKYAAPTLLRNKMAAIFFVPVGLIGEKDYMSFSNLKELVREGFEIGAHGFSHVPLSHLSKEKLSDELARSKKVLEDALGIEIISLSVPRGFYSHRIGEVARGIGYRLIFTSHFDVNRPSPKSSPRGGEEKGEGKVFRRMVVMGNTNIQEFERIVSGQLGARRYLEFIKEKARTLFGPSFYDGLAVTKRMLSSICAPKGGN
ncbi:MAG: polysaccharide deacetylase family protein [Candidatus Omnitrophica bacterium]|nr:polysaccharide deacetylase family protein [Candidatus Omnitrophota bacterium]